MNKSFVLVDKNNNVQKNAYTIVRFNFEENDYLIYSIDESNENGQIFVSKLIFNSEGKYFIDNISAEEKNKLSNLVYNIVIVLPTEESKGISFDSLKDDFSSKYSFNLSCNIPELGVQDYYSDCSIAVTSKILIDSAIKLYEEKLVEKVEEIVEVPTWTVPVQTTEPVPTPVVENEVITPANVSEENSVVAPVNFSNEEVTPATQTNVVENIEPIVEVAPIQDVKESFESEIVAAIDNVISEDEKTSTEPVDIPSQTEKVVVVSDPSLNSIGVGVTPTQPTVDSSKNGGFASNKYIIVGSICLVLAIAVVVGVYFLISNVK